MQDRTHTWSIEKAHFPDWNKVSFHFTSPQVFCLFFPLPPHLHLLPLIGERRLFSLSISTKMSAKAPLSLFLSLSFPLSFSQTYLIAVLFLFSLYFLSYTSVYLSKAGIWRAWRGRRIAREGQERKRTSVHEYRKNGGRRWETFGVEGEWGGWMTAEGVKGLQGCVGRELGYWFRLFWHANLLADCFNRSLFPSQASKRGCVLKRGEISHVLTPLCLMIEHYLFKICSNLRCIV